MSRATQETLPTVGGDVVRDFDAMTQDACGSIMALCKAARQALAPDFDALCLVRQLLVLVENVARDHEETINSIAERHGCNAIDADERAFTARLSAKINAARGNTGAAS